MNKNKPSAERVASRAMGLPMVRTAGEVRFIKDRGGDEKNFGWSGTGPSQREISNGFEFSPGKLKPLAKTLRSTLMALGHVQSAYHDFTKIKSAVISPDGNLGGKGYIQEIREMRRQYMNVSEALSALSDTIYDEINAPHWAVQAGEEQATTRTREDVAEIMDDVEEIRENPEEAADEMEEKWESEPGHAKTATRFPEPIGPTALVEWAAQEAAQVLTKNWKQTLRDDPGFSTDVMANDIDAVVKSLNKWKAQIQRMRMRSASTKTAGGELSVRVKGKAWTVTIESRSDVNIEGPGVDEYGSLSRRGELEDFQDVPDAVLDALEAEIKKNSRKIRLAKTASASRVARTHTKTANERDVLRAKPRMPKFEKWISQAQYVSQRQVDKVLSFAISEYLEWEDSPNPKGLIKDVKESLYDVDQMTDAGGDDIMPSFPARQVEKEFWTWFQAAQRSKK